MKTFIKHIAVGIAIIATINSCNPPVTTTTAPSTTAIDTTIKVDTTAPPAPERVDTTIIKDTVVKRAPLTLLINNLTSETAPVIVGVYGTTNKFPDPKDQLKEYRFTPHGKNLTAKITNLEFGQYAIAIYQDVNSNGKIDKNLIGIPTEPYAFSNNFKPTVRAPKFDNCKFEYATDNCSITMNMIK